MKQNRLSKFKQMMDAEKAITPLPEPAATSEEIVRVQQVVRELAARWERRAADWDALKAQHPFITSMGGMYREMAEDIRAVAGKLQNVLLTDCGHSEASK